MKKNLDLTRLLSDLCHRNDTQCRPRSDSSLIWICIVCSWYQRPKILVLYDNTKINRPLVCALCWSCILVCLLSCTKRLKTQVYQTVQKQQDYLRVCPFLRYFPVPDLRVYGCKIGFQFMYTYGFIRKNGSETGLKCNGNSSIFSQLFHALFRVDKSF